MVPRNLARALALTCVCVVTSAPASAAINAAVADDVCAPGADPCVVNQVVTVLPGAILDFGLRQVQVTGTGQLDVGAGTMILRCGELIMDATPTVLRVSDGIDPGLATIEVFRSCSGNGALRCLDDSVCAIAGAGTCSVGTGDFTLAGKINGNGEFPGAVDVTAAGNISILDSILLNGTTIDADGGVLDLVAGGSITVAAAIQVDGGQDAGGGDIFIDAGVDASITAAVEATGGSFQAATIEIDALRDVLVSADVNAAATISDGFGGDIIMAAGRDIAIAGGTSASPLVISTEGHTGVDAGTSFGGDGGLQTYDAGSAVSIGEFVRLRASGAAPDGYGNDVVVNAGSTISVDGDLEGKAKGNAAGGGIIELVALGDLSINSTSLLDVSGSSDGGGIVTLMSSGNLTMNGALDISASASGTGGSAELSAAAGVDIGGSITSAGTGAGSGMPMVSVRGCLDVTLQPGAALANAGTNAQTLVQTGAQMTLAAGASMTAGSGGSNRIEYADAGLPPVLAGSVTPSAVTVLVASIPGCAACGDGIVGAGETCDDGNTVAGDGCSADCQDEGCIAQTPGYPGVALCDDANPCSDDSCDGAGSCVHASNSASCDDGLFCNGADICSGGSCVGGGSNPCAGGSECASSCNEALQACQTPAFSACSDDGNACTDDYCDGLGACIHPSAANPCDDGDFCTIADTCSELQCLATDRAPLSGAKIVVKIKSGTANDRLLLKGSFALASLLSLPSDTGILLELRDSTDSSVYTSVLPAADIVNAGNKGKVFKFKDKAGMVVGANGVTTATIKRNEKKAEGRIKLKMRGFELPPILNQPNLSLSLLFGADPVVDDCLSGGAYVCTTKGSSKLLCQG